MAAVVKQAMAECGRPGPVLVFEGPPGSGKTSLLDALAELLHNRVPNAQLDLDTVRFEDDRDESGAIPSLVAQLAFQLARQTSSYGALRFPRLVIGLLVQQLDLEHADRETARQTVDAALRAHRGVDRWTGTLAEAANQLVAKVPGGEVVPATLIEGMFSGVLRLVNRWGPGRRFLLGPYQQWYGHQDRGQNDPPIEALVGLRRWSYSAKHNPGHQQGIDDLLMRAFLADLRDEYRRAERAGGWSFNSVLLLDNVDGELGQAFLTQLVRIRRDMTAGGTAQDPLTVVATSRGGLLSFVQDGGVMDVRDRPGRRNGSAGEQWWRRIPLSPLALSETRAMIAQLALSDGNTQRLAIIVHEFTRGHAAATDLLLAAYEREGRADADLVALLRKEVDGKPLEQRLRERLLAGVEAGSSPDLEVCAAARTPEPVKRLANKLKLPKARSGLEQAPLWGLDDDGVTLARRLLLRRLWVTGRWTEAFEALRADAAEQRDAELELYYRVAFGEWGPIAEALTRRLRPGVMPAWLEELHRIAEAPARPLPGMALDDPDPPVAPRVPRATEPEDLGPAPDTSGRKAPEVLALELAGQWILPESPPRFVTVLNLLTALSVSHDPLHGNNRGELYGRIAECYRELSEYPNLSCRELDALERWYRKLRRDWNDG
jgi:hypothetical protein